MPDLIDSNTINNSAEWDLRDVFPSGGQSFTTDAFYRNITSAKFVLAKHGLPTGNAVANLYAHSGTYGTSSVPDVAQGILAQSDTLDVSTLTTSYRTIELNFTGVNQIQINPNTYYVIQLYYDNSSGSNYVKMGVDGGFGGNSHDGNASYYDSSWHYSDIPSNIDTLFYVYGTKIPMTTDGTLFFAGD